MNRCEWCETFDGRYNTRDRKCCQVRMIALAPAKRRRQMLDAIAGKRGQKTADYAEHLATLELDRWRAYRAEQAKAA
jgi:hypothetical protein